MRWYSPQAASCQVSSAYKSFKELKSVGIDLDTVTQQLEDEGVEKFSAAFDRLMASLEEKMVATV